MSPEEIRTEFHRKRKECSMASIGRSVGVSRVAVHRVIDRHFVSDKIMRAIADALGKNVSYVFPEYYLSRRGPRKPGRPRADNNPI